MGRTQVNQDLENFMYFLDKAARPMASRSN